MHNPILQKIKFSICLIAILQVHKISCQLDYDTDAGLNDSFQPSLKASCVGGTMTVRVDTKKPFEGIVYASNRTEEGCSVLGRGGLKTYLRIDLGKDGGCGVKYNPRTEERKVAIAVRAHPTIELLEDRLYVVTCGRAGFQNSRNEISVVELKVTLPGQEERKISTVLEGSKYQLKAQVLDHDPEFDILVRRCFAFDETETSIQLVDDRGCAIERLISNFQYDKAAGTAHATIRSMFRLPHSNRTYFQCDVAICKGECTKPNCNSEDEKLKLQSQGELANLNDRKPETIDPFERPDEADSVTTSTSVFVAQPGSDASAAAVYCTGVGWGSYYSDWLMWLCIAFAILFGIMLIINIFLCSAMTCSCTKSEIIEKEPSVYDDYSIYESQYGYTNGGKVYGSESDYGSEYGSTGEPAQPNHHEQYPAAPSENGTLRSKYSQGHPNSTLTRNRH